MYVYVDSDATGSDAWLTGINRNLIQYHDGTNARAFP